MSNLPELTPELAEALRKFRAGYREHSAELADAFAALYPEPELKPGIYRCEWRGEPVTLHVRSGRYRFVVVPDDGNKTVDVRGESDVTNIRRIDDCPTCAAWKEWATLKRASLQLDIGTILRSNRWSEAADELAKLLETP